MNDVARPKVALITGITGQDGSYLTELLLSKGYEVHGLVRQTSTSNTIRIQHLYADQCKDGQLKLHVGDLTQNFDLVRILGEIRPVEIYNLGAQTQIGTSFESAEYTANVNALGTLRLLEAIRTCGLEETARFYQASSCDMFSAGQGSTTQPTALCETTPLNPSSPYGVAKSYSYWMIRNYREAYKMFLCSGILFNHESPRRSESFVTRKVSRSVAKISLGQTENFELGNLNSRRDWGHAKDYVHSMWMTLQHEKPDDFVIATGETHSVRELVETAFRCVNKSIQWQGQGEQEVGIEQDTNIVRVRVNPKFYRPIEGAVMTGDASKAERELGWKSTIKFQELVREMVEFDIEQIKKSLN